MILLTRLWHQSKPNQGLLLFFLIFLKTFSFLFILSLHALICLQLSPHVQCDHGLKKKDLCKNLYISIRTQFSGLISMLKLLLNYGRGKRARTRVQRLCNSVQLLFCSSERSLMALGINGKVISKAYALGPARGGLGLCATVCTPTWIFVCVCVDTCMCCLLYKATHNRRAWSTAKESWEKQTHGQTNAHSYNQNSMYWHGSASSFAPRDDSLLVCRLSTNSQTEKKQKY